MSVYVDPLFACLQNKNWKYDNSCHLVGDTEKELHAFAKKLGLKREWFHEHRRLNHYDLYKTIRAKAVKMGAIEITRREIVKMMKPRGK
jgi:hypothetical protein